MKTLNRSVSRRAFVTGGLFAAAAFPFIGHGRNAVGKATLALIGAGKQGRNLLHAFLGQPNLVVTAVCDCDRVRREDRARVVNDYYAANPQLGVPGTACRAVADFRAVLADPSIDMVCIATPDHWHAYMAVEAMKAGKDVYCEKPLTHTVEEAKAVMAAAAKYGRILQTGAIQRSGIEFRTACMVVRNGGIGRVSLVDVNYGGPSRPHRDFENPANAAAEGAPNPDVDFDMWCGGAPRVKYSDRLAPRGVHDFFPMFWRFDDYFGLGMCGDWGAHKLDIAQWGLGLDG
ncbi:MAG: Gfo/Idh/MocA family oxidoreductase, partial [bacterium]|nr:Gfo/Idh/MocA family oxidoreductase [bacterium]